MTQATDFFARLGVRHPLVQAPMAGIGTPALAAAVSNAGALGFLALGGSTPSQAHLLIADTRALGAQAFGVNVFCHRAPRRDLARESAWLAHLAPFFRELTAEVPSTLREPYGSFLDDPAMLDVLLALRPAVVSFHFGVPAASIVARLRQAGMLTMATATTLEEARQVEAAGIDAIVAQGHEAGGHRGVFLPELGDAALGTLALVRLLAAHTSRPVLAAGGIMDGRGIAAALALGAIGVQLGTAFLLCPESATTEAHRAALRGPLAFDTRITASISGRPARGLPNRLVLDPRMRDAPPVPDYPVAYDAARVLHAAAVAQGKQDFAVHWAGQGAPLLRELSAAALVNVLMHEVREAQRAGS